MKFNVSLESLAEMTTNAIQRKGADELVTLEPEELLDVLEDYYWARLSEHEARMYLDECGEKFDQLRAIGLWEGDEWDAVTKLAQIREILGIE